MSTERTDRKRPAMVDWYGPSQLAKTGMKTLLSTLLGTMIDTRRLQVGSGRDKDCVVDYSEREGFCFDYMADTGDGWDSTYTMAYLLTRPYIEASGQRLDRADIAILGGDEVYPVASRQDYQNRLLNPFERAADGVRDEPEFSSLSRNDMFMVPGNHDWYDSLGAFTRRFLAYRVENNKLLQREVGQFDVRQVRSYFVLKLPRQWEIWAIDVQLGHDIDNDQQAFFRKHAETIGADTKIILCSAEPTIVSGEEQKESGLEFSIKRITYFAYRKGARVLVQLAGDVHNYQRYEVPARTKVPGGGRETRQYTRLHIVSGGGGAFLHPNHSFNKGSEKSPRIEPRKRYPDRKTSKKLTKRALWFAFSHKGMAALIGVLYLGLFWSSGLDIDPLMPIEHPGSVLLFLVALLGSMGFAGLRSAKTAIWGFFHGSAHIALAACCWWLGYWLAPMITSAAVLDTSMFQIYVPRLLTFVLAFLLGGTLFGFYLWFSLNVLRLHHNETFSALSWPHHKNFLRCCVEDDGSLAIHVVGVEKTASDDQRHPVETHLVETVTITP